MILAGKKHEIMDTQELPKSFGVRLRYVQAMSDVR